MKKSLVKLQVFILKNKLDIFVQLLFVFEKQKKKKNNLKTKETIKAKELGAIEILLTLLEFKCFKGNHVSRNTNYNYLENYYPLPTPFKIDYLEMCRHFV